MKKKTLKISILGIICVLALIWLHGFIYMNSYGRGGSAIGVILWAAIVIIGTVIGYYVIISLCDIAIENALQDVGWICPVVVGFFFLLFLLMAAWAQEYNFQFFSLYQGGQIVLFGLTFQKKYMCYVCAVIVFPFFMELTGKIMQKEEFSDNSILAGSFLVVSLSVTGYFIFRTTPGVYHGNLALLNLFALCIALQKYIWKSDLVFRKKMVIGLFLLGSLVFVWVMGFHELVHGTENITEYIFGGNWNGYTENVRTLLENAAFFGKSEQLAAMKPVHEWLHNRDNFIHQLLYYGGWSSVIGWFVCMAGLLAAEFQLLGMRNKQMHGHQVVFMTAFGMLLIRTVLGVLYSFAIIPYPVALPFAGQEGIYTDCMAFALLLVCAYENYLLNKKQGCRLADVADFLGKSPEYVVKDQRSGEVCNEVLYYRKVVVHGRGRQICCLATESDFYEGYAVFWPQEGKHDSVFILQRQENAVWEIIKDKNVLPALLSEYRNKWMVSDTVDLEYGAMEEMGSFLHKNRWRILTAVVLAVFVFRWAWIGSLDALYGSNTSINRLWEEEEQKYQESNGDRNR